MTFGELLNELEVNNEYIQKATENIGEVDKINQQIAKLVAQNPNGVPTAQLAAVLGKGTQKTGSATANIQSGLTKIQQQIKQKELEDKKKKEAEEKMKGTSTTPSPTGVGSNVSLSGQKPTPRPGDALNSLNKPNVRTKMINNLTKKKM